MDATGKCVYPAMRLVRMQNGTGEKNVIGSVYQRQRNALQVVDMGLQAEREGHDAFVVLGLGVAAYEEPRDNLKIAVVYA